MQTLTAFESAARLASFTAAARELGSTQPAVSQRIVQLEEELGTPLFERGHRGVTLTPEGTLLSQAVRSGLDTIREATADIRARRATGSLTILTDAGFASYWLMPRLARLNASMPGVNVKIVTSDGRVTLRGPVNSDAERDAINRIARDVAGEGNVDDQVEVKSP